jgi:putative membrane protein
VNRETGSVLLVLVGGALLRIAAGETYLRYVKAGLRVPLLVAGAILVLLGLVSLWRENPGARSRRSAPYLAPNRADQATDHWADHRADHRADQPERTDAAGPAGHRHGHRVAWLLLLPVFAIFLIAPPALGSYAADRDTAVQVPPPAASGDFPPLPAGDPVTVRLDEYEARSVWDAGRTLAGRRVALVGFVTLRPGGGYYLTRIVITCCAADATAARVLVTGAGAGGFGKDTWLEVVGHYAGVDHSRDGQIGPIAQIGADSVRQVPTPVEPYQT